MHELTHTHRFPKLVQVLRASQSRRRSTSQTTIQGSRVPGHHGRLLFSCRTHQTSQLVRVQRRRPRTSSRTPFFIYMFYIYMFYIFSPVHLTFFTFLILSFFTFLKLFTFLHFFQKFSQILHFTFLHLLHVFTLFTCFTLFQNIF